MEKKDVKSNLLEHSDAKVSLLGEYLKRYLNIICNDGYTKGIRVFDVFCGEGLYENGGEGSPLVIMRCIKDIHTANVAKREHIIPIDCAFNDIAAEKIEKVKQSISEKSLYYNSFGSISFSCDDYEKKVKELISMMTQLNKEKSFIFIDPYEYKHIKASHIKDLMSRGNAEVLLWLPTQFMYRFATNGTPLALKDFIDELNVLNSWKDTSNVWQFIEQLKKGFQSYLGENIFVDTFTIQKDASTVFCLFFFSSHIRGFEKMLEAKWEIDTEQGKGWNYKGNTPSLFFNQRTNPLEEKLKFFLLGNKRFNGEIYDFTLRQGFLPTHTNDILLNWQQNGQLLVELPNGEKARKGSFYIGYKYFKDKHEGQKVIFKLR